MTIRKLCSLLALLSLIILAGCAAGTRTGQGPTPTVAAATETAIPSQLDLTFLGSDGNVWEMAWPQGTPKQFTTDAQADQVRYSGLAWSPDGARLAVLRETGPLSNPASDTLVLLAPDGMVLAQMALAAQPQHTPFAWSPDGTLIAYRTETGQADQATGNIKGRLTIIDAQTGATKQTLLYNEGRGGGCGGAFSPLVNAVMAAHNAYLGVDTFVWTPDQGRVLVSPACGNTEALRVDLGSGQTTAGYPKGVSYQPGGNSVLLGQWYVPATITLGLANASGAELRALTSETLTGNEPVTTIGVATWSADGQAIYYEHDNGIWSIGVDGSNAHQVVAGALNDAQNQATVEVLPSVSPSGALLLYLQLRGANAGPGAGSVAAQCFVAESDGSNASALPHGASSAAWRPVK
jgi:hypothetical protein